MLAVLMAADHASYRLAPLQIRSVGANCYGFAFGLGFRHCLSLSTSATTVAGVPGLIRYFNAPLDTPWKDGT